MPTLIPLTDFRGEQPIRDARLYFKKASWDRHGNGHWRWSFNVDDEYPHMAAIHRDVIDDEYSNDNTFFVDLRRWVERQAEGDVIFQYKNMSHKWWWNKEATTNWDKKFSDIRHGYWFFNFESESDLAMFALMHGEKLSKPQKYHPDYADEIMKDENKHDPRYY